MIALEKDVEIDLESGANAVISDQERSSSNEANRQILLRNGFCVVSSDREASRLLKNGENSGDGDVGEDERMGLLGNKTGNESSKDKALRNPAKPPRPPRSLSLDAANKKIVKEMSELAMIKRARLERMKALKNMKNAKAGSSSSNLCALFVTVLFCVIIIWHGVSSKAVSSLKAHGSPESTVLQYDGHHL
ncbi:hypothetical protein HPP92_016078 [Vanilla planifolia]|uniref:Uncharacterized protein n=1 Tax=Vanilla planifolia TaxID=51239 RepID=A0A835UWD9_VANPL|nr:hypothetical protein HPP92_016078 [Vanilla planifolia]